MTRRKLPKERHSITHEFRLQDDTKIYVTAGMHDDGKLGEIFLTASKEGSFVSGLLDAFAASVSIALQHDAPLATLAKRMKHMRFEPLVVDGAPDIAKQTSVTDYLFRWLEARFPSGIASAEIAELHAGEKFDLIDRSGPDKPPQPDQSRSEELTLR